MGKELDRAVIEQLKDSIPIEQFAESLGLIEDLRIPKGFNKPVGKCPDHESEGHTCLQLWKKENIFYCHQCKTAFDHFTLLAKKMSFIEIAELLAKNYRPDLLEAVKASTSVSPYYINKAEYKNADLFKAIYEWGNELLYKSEGTEAYNYLTQVRGYDPTKLRLTEWMYWPKEPEIRNYLKSKFPERHHEIDELIFTGNGGDNFRAAFPYRDRSGKILAFVKRHTTKEGLISDDVKGIRWSSPKGFTKDDLFNLYNCKRSKQYKQSKQLIIVEGLPDALYLPALGFENIVAVSQGGLSEKYIEGLKICETERVIVIFDNDNKQQTIDNITKAADILEENDIRAFVMPPEYLMDCKDPDEFVVKYGIEEFDKLVKKSWSRASWIPYYLSKKYDLSACLEKENALSEAAKSFASLTIERDKSDFKKTMQHYFKLSSDELEDEIARAEEKHKEHQTEERKNQVQKEVQELISKGKLTEAQDRLEEFESEEKVQSLPEYKPAANLLKHHEEYLDQFRGKTYVGLPQKKLPTLDKMTLGLRGLDLLAAAPNIGKTALTIQLTIDVLKENQDACALYLSLEMSKNEILSRIRCHLSKMDWKTLVLGSDKQSSDTFFLEEDFRKIEHGNTELAKLGDRLEILSKTECGELTVEKVLRLVERHKANTNCSRIIIVVDYLQVWPIPHFVMKDLRTDIQTDQWRIGQLREISEALEGNPIFAISEARKPGEKGAWGGELSDVMGSSRGTYTPDMVLLFRSILTESELISIMDKKQNDLKPHFEVIFNNYKDKGIDIQKLSLSKGRDGMTKGDIYLKFFYRQNRFEEISKEEFKREIDGIINPKPAAKKSHYETDSDSF